MANKDLYFKLQHITALGHDDIGTSHSSPGYPLGGISIVADPGYGTRIFKYIWNKEGAAITQKGTVSKVANTAVNNITSGTTTKAVTTSLTADAHDNKICYVLDNADSAAAAPEGESSVVKSNTTTDINMYPEHAFSVALAANDDLILVATHHGEDGAEGDEAVDGLGIAMADISDGEYGWVCMEGYVPAQCTASTAVTADECLVASAATLGASTANIEDHWGYAVTGSGGDAASTTVIVNMKLFSAQGISAQI